MVPQLKDPSNYGSTIKGIRPLKSLSWPKRGFHKSPPKRELVRFQNDMNPPNLIAPKRQKYTKPSTPTNLQD